MIKKTTYAWYAVYTKTNFEKRIKGYLNQQNIECYLPVHKTLKQWSDRKKWIEEPLFKSYIFVRVSNVEFFNVLNIPGVFSYVSFGGKPQTIPDYEIENVKIFVEQGDQEVILTREKIASGMKVRIQHGPLKGVIGEVVQMSGHSRIMIRVESLGYCLSLNVSKNMIKDLTSSEAEFRRIPGNQNKGISNLAR
ncbi:UpxY family transcription antiterminator [uncultured Draconibacterium sp.]|uniref:UpxY family transcription antiterminator n=1 Tax=uncultured Draconibacterium sp. TaxID=1573823 RepID=UPI002AA75A86|nr:UpxY family transcription antiterminator [uncultured Draconibacterium sp.]